MKNFKDIEKIETDLILALNEQCVTNYSLITEKLQPNGIVEKRESFVNKVVQSKEYDVKNKAICDEEVEDILGGVKFACNHLSITDDESQSLLMFILRLDELVE